MDEKMFPLEIKEEIVESVNIIKKEIEKEFTQEFIKRYLNFYAKISENQLDYFDFDFGSSAFGHISLILWNIMYLCPEEGKKIMEEFLKEKDTWEAFERLSKEINTVVGFVESKIEKDYIHFREHQRWEMTSSSSFNCSPLPKRFDLYLTRMDSKMYFTAKNELGVFGIYILFLKKFISDKYFPFSKENIVKNIGQALDKFEPGKHEIKYGTCYKDAIYLCNIKEIMTKDLSGFKPPEEIVLAAVDSILGDIESSRVGLSLEKRGLISAGCIFRILNKEPPENLLGILIKEAEMVIKEIKELGEKIKGMEKIKVDSTNTQLSATYVVVEGARNKCLGKFLELVPIITDFKRIFC